MNSNTVIKNVATRSPPPNAISKVYTTGNVIEIRTMEKYPLNISQYRRISNNSCVDMSTGEIIKFNHSERRSENKHGLYKSFATLRRIINLNFQGRHSEVFLTLTYRTKMTDPEQLYWDFRVFWKRLKRRDPSLEYITIVEPQHTGSYHIHVLLKKMDYALLYIPMEHLMKLWSHGATHVQRLKNVDNLGAYFTAHLKNVDLSEEDEMKPHQHKAIVKGSRVKYYPARFRLFRCSKGIIRAKPRTMTYKEAKAMVKHLIPCYTNSKSINRVLSDGTTEEVNRIVYEQYNLRRDKHEVE